MAGWVPGTTITYNAGVNTVTVSGTSGPDLGVAGMFTTTVTRTGSRSTDIAIARSFSAAHVEIASSSQNLTNISPTKVLNRTLTTTVAYVRLELQGWTAAGYLYWYPTGSPLDPEGSTPSNAKGTLPALIPGLPATGLPTTPVIDGPATDPLNSADAAYDIADRSGIKLIDRGDGWEVLDPIPTPTVPALIVEHGINLISADHVVDIDDSTHAQQVLLVYDWPDPDNPGQTVTRTAWSADPKGDHTLVIRRSGIPATQEVAQATATALGARAWLRGAELEVVVTCCAWVRPGHTVRVTLPDDSFRDWWCASARHDSVTATSRLVLRAFSLDPYAL